MSDKIIYGIQQIGIGVENVHEAWAWYRKYFGMDIKAFEEAAVAELMMHYTEGKARPRHAVLAINMQSGGGFEVWQHTGKTPLKPKFEVQLGDLGIFMAKMKTQDIKKAYQWMKSQGVDVLGEVVKSPNDKSHFFVRDPYGNIFQIIEDDYVFVNTSAVNGGVLGAVIGVSDIDKAMKLYSETLGFSQVVYDTKAVFADLKAIAGGGIECRRVLLRKPSISQGGFSPLLGPNEIELVQALNSPVRKIYENRIWGDPGFIHLCFDIHNMTQLEKECEANGFPFTVDSKNSFDMGQAAGHFAYVSDPDGTPIEFVETHKLPLIKAIGWGINLTKRDPKKNLPKWILKALALKRVKS